MNRCLDSSGVVGPKSVLAIIVLVIFTVFILQNTEVVQISFFFWRLSLSRVVLLFGALLIGVLVGLFIGWETGSSKKKRNSLRV